MITNYIGLLLQTQHFYCFLVANQIGVSLSTYSFVLMGVVVQWLSSLPAVWEDQVRYPLSATIDLACECTFTRANPCHVRGIGHHHSDTRVWGDMLDSVVFDSFIRFYTCESRVLPCSLSTVAIIQRFLVTVVILLSQRQDPF